MRSAAMPANPDEYSDPRLATLLEILQAAAPALGNLGVLHLSVFGSIARGTARPDSDVDLLIELNPQREIDLFDYAGISGEIQRLLPRRVDLALRDTLKPHLA